MSSIQSVERAMDILNLIGKNKKGMGITEISKATNIHKSTVYRTVNSMCKKNFLYKDEESNKYLLGINSLILGFSASENIYLSKLSKPYMAFLSEKYRENVKLTLFTQDYTIMLNYYLGNYSTSFFSHDNQRRLSRPYRPAIVYSMLAYQSSLKPDDPLLIDYKGGSLDRGPKTMEELIDILKEVRKNGYSYEREDFHPDEICYAAPIFSGDMNAIATISIHGTDLHLGRFNSKDLIKDIKMASKLISEEIEDLNKNDNMNLIF